MFYKPISIREAVRNINEIWFLPAIQRPYDWGERTKKEQFISKLFDSLIRRYPIGTLIIWETKQKIPFRDFLADYNSEKLAKIRDKGLWGKSDKHLVYDGQQRLQSLYSCLKYTFHNKVLCYDLLFDSDLNKEPEEFSFFQKNESPEPRYLKLNELFACNRRQEAEFEEEILNKFGDDLNKDKGLLVKKNFKNLWNIFVEEDIKLLSYYPLEVDLNEKEVLDIFKRINTTGMQLTKSEILFSEVKRIQFDFEEVIWDVCSKIKEMTSGFSVNPDDVLKILFLLIKGGVRVDPERVDESELKDFVKVWNKLESPLCSFFHDFLYKEFKINHEKIINLKNALIPIIVYFYYMKSVHNYKFRNFTSQSIMNMKKYLLISQLNYWDMQSYIDNFHKIIKGTLSTKTNKNELNFPFEKLRNFVKINGKRDYGLKSEKFNDSSLRWFTLKMLIPYREYQYTKNPDERFNPEIDHIFPLTPESKKEYPSKYYEWVDTIWNLQPVKGEINGVKLNKSPKDFFSTYKIYLQDYDFLPAKSLKSRIWLDKYAEKFIKSRRNRMLAFVRKEYGLKIEN